MSLQAHVHALRANPTDAERRLWYLLRSRRMGNLKFRRQRPMGPYIVDFVCLECRLIIEVDGGHHQEQERADRARDAALRSRGFLVLRFWNNEVLKQTNEVVEKISAIARQRRPSPLPVSRTRERGGSLLLPRQGRRKTRSLLPRQ